MGRLSDWHQRKADEAEVARREAQHQLLRAHVAQLMPEAETEFKAGDHDAFFPLLPVICGMHAQGLGDEAESLRDRIAEKLSTVSPATVDEIDAHLDKMVGADARVAARAVMPLQELDP